MPVASGHQPLILGIHQLVGSTVGILLPIAIYDGLDTGYQPVVMAYAYILCPYCTGLATGMVAI